MKYMRTIYRKDPKFSDRSSAQTVQTEISLLRNRSDKGLHSCHSVCTLLQNRNKRPIIVRQGTSVLAAGAGWKLIFFFGGGGAFVLTLMGICQEMKW